MTTVPTTSIKTLPYSTVAKVSTNGAGSGVLVSPTFMLTAQHVITSPFPSSTLSATFGATSATDTAVKNAFLATTTNPIDYFRGPLPVGSAGGNEAQDVALVQLDRNAMFSSTGTPRANIDGMAFFADSRDVAGVSWLHAGYPGATDYVMKSEVGTTYQVDRLGQPFLFTIASGFFSSLDIANGQSGGPFWLTDPTSGERKVGGVLIGFSDGFTFDEASAVALSTADQTKIMNDLKASEAVYNPDDLPRNVIYGSKAGGAAFSNLSGSYRRDLIVGGAGAETIDSQGGADAIYGGGGG
jgi:V8-like Glu-specific endopeptidase